MTRRTADRRTARRTLLLGLGASLPWPGVLLAQGTGQPRRIAFLAAGMKPRPGQFSSFEAIQAGLRERGYTALQTQTWYADGHSDALPGLAQQVVAWKPELIVTNLTPATLAAQRATRTIPIVMAGSGDPVATGLVQSLSRPGGNVTGVAALGPELAAKSVELMHELQPGLRRLGVLAHATDIFTAPLLAALTRAAGVLGLELLVERVREPTEYAAVFEGWSQQRVDAVFVQPSLPGRPAAEMALRHRLPAGSFVRSFVEQGGLVAYTTDLAETARLVVDIVDRILRGASPATLPVLQNSRFDLLLNLRTAQALKLKIPPTLLARATEVLE